MIREVFVVRPAWRREWKSFLSLALLVLLYINVEWAIFYAAKPLTFVERTFRQRIDWALFANLALLVAIAWTIAGLAFRHYRHQYRFTEEGVSHVIGILGGVVRPLSYRSITLATKKQKMFEVIFGVGSLFLHSSGTDTADVILTGVPSPQKLLDHIQSGMRRAQTHA